MANLLGIDLGTSSVKVLVADENGRILSRGSADYPLLTPKPGRVEQDPHDWWQAAVMAVRQAMTGLKGDP
ncbi:MAG: FGGY family carbohydrate kinase, partial [Anaerolineales bacterium]